MIGLAVFVGISFLGILWANTVLSRRRVRKQLLESGTRVAGTPRLVTTPGVRHPRIHVDFRQTGGAERTVIKSVVSAGDHNLVMRKVMVIYDGQQPGKEDRMLIGFGFLPTRWFRVRLTRRTGS